MCNELLPRPPIHELGSLCILPLVWIKPLARLQEIFSALPLHCAFVRTELPSRLATLRLRLPCIFLWVCAELLSRLPRHLRCSICNALYVCTELFSWLSRHLLCSTSNALLLSTELLSRFSRYLSISLHRSFVRTEQLSRLPRFLLCYPLREGFSKASVSWFKPFSQGLCISLCVYLELLSRLPKDLLSSICTSLVVCSSSAREGPLHRQSS